MAFRAPDAFALPTPAISYELQLTVAPLTVQVAEVPAWKCAPVGPLAGSIVVVMVARAAEADTTITNVDNTVMIPTRLMFLPP